MTDKIKALWRKYREIIMYLIFGVLTTVVSFGAYYTLLWCGVYYITAQVISWAAAVAFAQVRCLRREGLALRFLVFSNAFSAVFLALY